MANHEGPKLTLSSLLQACKTAQSDPYEQLKGVTIGVHPADLYRLCHDAVDLAKGGVDPEPAFRVLRSKVHQAKDFDIVVQAQTESHLALAESKGFRPGPALVVTLLADAEHSRLDPSLQRSCLSAACKCLDALHESFRSSNDLKLAWVNILNMATGRHGEPHPLEGHALALLGDKNQLRNFLSSGSEQNSSLIDVLNRKLLSNPDHQYTALSLHGLRRCFGVNPFVNKWRSTSPKEDFDHAEILMRTIAEPLIKGNAAWYGTLNAKETARQLHEAARLLVCRVKEDFAAGDHSVSSQDYRRTYAEFLRCSTEVRKQLAILSKSNRADVKGLKETLGWMDDAAVFLKREQRIETAMALTDKWARKFVGIMEMAEDTALALSRFEVNRELFGNLRDSWRKWMR